MFDYQPGDSLVHRLNPLTKVVLSVGLSVIVFLAPNYWGPALIAGLLFVLALSAGLFSKVARLAAAIVVPLAATLLFIQGIFYSGDPRTPLLVIGPVILWREGVLFGLLICLRVLVIVCVILLTIFSTHPKKMTIALMEKGMSPKLAYVFMASLQFLPDMQRRAQAILEAQQARGLNVKANLWRRFRALIAMMVPLLAGALISAETRSLALEARGFSRKGTHTHLLDVPDSRTDRVLRWGTVAAVLVAAAWRIASWA
jgi:energy-coupling factor transport system permease protein